MIKRFRQRAVSLLLTAGMLLPMASEAFAVQPAGEQSGSAGGFNFEYSEYAADEKDSLTIRVTRSGAGEGEAVVTFKVADLLTEYGKDYVVLDADGHELTRVEGSKPSLSDLEEDEPEDERTEEQSETSDVPPAASAEKKEGSSLMNAAYAYLDIPDAEEKKETENQMEGLLENAADFFIEAQGAWGQLRFAPGEETKSITVRPIDNDTSDGTRVFLLSLTGASGEFQVAPNATTYVSLIDDEPAIRQAYELIGEPVTLTPEAPEAQFTIRRTEGVGAFGKVYLSTVGGTAPDGSYEEMIYRTVSFLPGETEKTASVRAFDFSEGGTFGVRLEALDGVEIGDDYLEFSMERRSDAPLMLLTAPSGAVLLGSRYTTLRGTGASSWPVWGLDCGLYDTYWKKDVTGGDGDNCAKFVSNVIPWDDAPFYYDTYSALEVRNENKDKHSMLVTVNPYDFTGVYGLAARIKTDGKGSSKKTYFEIDSDQTYSGSIASWKKSGSFDWTDVILNTGAVNRDAYIKFAVTPDSSGDFNKPHSLLAYPAFIWAEYDFDLRKSNGSFSRMVYDFDGHLPGESGFETVTFYDDETQVVYDPGTVVVQDSSADNVSGFYASADAVVTITAEKEAQNLSKGIFLKGVYLASTDVAASQIPSADNAGKSVSKAVYYAASDGVVTLSLNQALVSKLITAGVVSSTNKERESIRIYPVFEQEKVIVTFRAADDNGSVFLHVSEAYQNKLNVGGQPIVSSIGGSGRAYAVAVPIHSVLRMGATPANGRMMNGILCEDANGSSLVYRKAGGTLYSAMEKSGIPITSTDYARADIPVSRDTTLTPNTEKQSITVCYFDRTGVTDSNRPDDLTNRVVCFDNEVASGADGVLYFDDVCLGQTFTFTAIPPEGCYTVWVNMTGDTNGDGKLSDAEKAAEARWRGDQSAENPWYYVGDRLSVTLKKDGTRYCYQFMKKDTSGVSEIRTGRIERQNSTFWRILNGLGDNGEPLPVEGAMVNIAGENDVTDETGSYKVKLEHTANYGYVSSVAVAGGSVYNYVSVLEETGDYLLLPAMETFEPKGLTLLYGKSSNAQYCSGNTVMARSDTLKITAKVSSDTMILPSGARFFLYRNGSLLFEFDPSEVSFTQSGSVGYAVLSFNPKETVRAGDRIWVSFSDQNGREYPAVDLGLNFTTELSFVDFTLPLIGAELAEPDGDFVFDIIGNALSSISLGSLGLDYELTQRSAHANVSDAELEAGGEKYEWTEMDYSFGFSKKYAGKSKADKNKEKKDDPSEPADPSGTDAPPPADTDAPPSADAEDAAAEADAAQETIEQLRADEQVEGAKPTKNSSFSTKSSYSWHLKPEFGFRLTVSDRRTESGSVVTCFEDLTFYFKVNGGGEISVTINLPIGMAVVIGLNLNADVVGVYHMYNAYPNDPTHTQALIPYNAEELNIFGRFNDTIRGEGYIFLDPSITTTLKVKAGIVEVQGSAKFRFDMDFHFPYEGAVETYGALAVDLGWKINLVGFTVYSKNYKDTLNVHLFGQDDPISFNYKKAAVRLAAQGVQKAASAGFSEEGGVFSTDTPAGRTYLENRTGWTGAGLLLGANSSGADELVLQNGVGEDPNPCLLRMEDGRIMLVFIGDDPSRSDVNRRAVWCSFSENDGRTFASPFLLDDDGTLDDHPDLFDLGDRVLVTWSSAETVLPDDATVEDALRSLNIKAVFYDKAAKTFGEVVELTKTTDEDYCADTLPHAAYDPETERLLLFYTKTEFDELKQLGDIGAAASMTAYLFCENGVWSNTGSAYGDAELASLPDDEAKDLYREQWYGQRFLDVRIDNGSEMPRIISSDAVSYNGLALFTWVADWDGSQDTTGDRDVFLQIYNFSENSFTHIIRVTEQSGSYTQPLLLRTDDVTYLFFGVLTDGETGEIRYFDVSESIRGGQYMKDAGRTYYELKAIPEDSEETVWQNFDTAAACSSLENFTVCQDGNGGLIVYWTAHDSETDSHHIFASVLEGDPAGDEKSGCWSEPLRLTKDEDVFYSGVGALSIGERLLVISGKGSYSDESDRKLIRLHNSCFTDIALDRVTIDTALPVPGGVISVTAELCSRGLTASAGAHTVVFTLNGGEPVTATVEEPIPGAGRASVSVFLPVPESFDTLTVEASFDGESLTAEKEAAAAFEWTNVLFLSEGPRFEAELSNVGSRAGSIRLDAWTNSRTVGSLTVSLEAGERQNVSLPLALRDEDYVLTAGGSLAQASLTVEGTVGEDAVLSADGSVVKRFDANAAALLLGAGKVSSEVLVMDKGETAKLTPSIENGTGLRAFWKTSSDESVVKVTADGSLTAVGDGSAQISGLLIPEGLHSEADRAGNISASDWETLIPSYLQRTVTASVKVGSGGTISPFLPIAPTHQDGVIPTVEDFRFGTLDPDDGTGEDTPTADDPAWSGNEPAPSGNESTGSETLRFTDIDPNEYYYEPLVWAVENGIVTDGETFGPEEGCTREEIVVYLWKAAGCPEPSENAPVFRDVEPGCVYEKAVRWAAEQLITLGTGGGLFSPDEAVDRAQTVTFLWRACGCELPQSSEHSFVDVDNTDYYLNALLWAVEHAVTNGTSEETFSPFEPCTRAQIITFLRRTLQ